MLGGQQGLGMVGGNGSRRTGAWPGTRGNASSAGPEPPHPYQPVISTLVIWASDESGNVLLLLDQPGA